MSDFELRINVHNGSKIGHANISFYENGEHVYTLGANIRIEGPLLVVPQIGPFEFEDGIYRDETAYHAQAVETRTVISAQVPVTDMQYADLLSTAHTLDGQTFNYSVFTEACIELVEDFYEATGHPGEFGDLFAAEDRSGSLVWSRVPVSYDSPISTWPDDQPLYSPPEPIMPDPPTPPATTIFAAMPDPPAFSIDVSNSEGISRVSAVVANEANSPEAQLVEDLLGLPANHDLPGNSLEENSIPEELPPGPEPVDAPQGEVGEAPETPTGGSTPPDLTLKHDIEGEAIISPLLSEPNVLVLPFPVSTTGDDDVGHSSGSRSFSTDVGEPKEVGFRDAEQTSPNSASPAVDSGLSFDLATDDFDFFDTISSTDLSFGDDIDGSDMMDALSTPREDPGLSFESPSIDDDTDHASYDHGYDEFGLFI